ncbi:ATP-binding protein [Pilimelia terevasa]|uniref:ATP-binding protein n=1 Tax=Pilimelia terevasa TaxID=53372 RepID=UPI001E35566E|nr:ATP-binding protein [Pilimelia terevasa]
MRGQAPPAELRLLLRPAVGAARAARELVTEACARGELAPLAGAACTVVTELVNNAVVHARTPLELVIGLRADGLDIAVHDGSAQLPQPRQPVAPAAPGGRGMVMVAALATRWGADPRPGGKVVWATLDAAEPA